jgi:NTP pyrophosphatase (non-canonical NTP hydrolase)
MELSELIKRSDEIKHQYAELNRLNGHRQWGVAEYTQGFVADVGALTKHIMAKNQYRSGSDVDRKIAHELVDCLWFVLILASELEIDLEGEFLRGMNTLEERISVAKGAASDEISTS